MKTTITLLTLFLIVVSSFAQSNLKNPSFEEVLSLKNVGTPYISPDGRHIAFTKSTVDWKDNRWDNEIWLSKDDNPAFQLTNTAKGSSGGIVWSPDGQWIAFRADRGDKSQIFVINVNGGEAIQVTREKEGVGGFDWMPDGKTFVFSKSAPEAKDKKSRSERYGAYNIDDQDYRMTWLYQIPFDPFAPAPSELPCYDKEDEEQEWECIEWPKSEALIDSVEYTIRGFDISPDGQSIAITHTPNPLINTFFDADISILDIESKTVTTAVSNSSADSFIDWSPDGKQFMYSSDLDNRTSNYYLNNRLFIKSINGGAIKEVGQDFDEDISIVDWNDSGIYAIANQRTERHLFKLDPSSGKMSLLLDNPNQIFWATFNSDGSKIAFRAETGDDLSELYVSGTGNLSPRKITDQSAQISNWKTAKSEVVNWNSKDGANIEGMLHKPMDFDPAKKYPLLVVIHGGPTGVDRADAVFGYVYPINQWLNKGAIVLRVNYRGSAGYGEKFRSLNVGNLGVGDAWDVLSGVDHMISKGYIDEDRMGCMGWSQGGYISAFLTTNTDRFKGISVGAGISNWMTYYVNTDIHPFTRQYLKDNPWNDEAVYKKTSPMTNILNASTPTLIQHGEFDNRVPIANGYELLQGLRDVGVESKMIVYKGFGHGITKPKERLAAIWHNWAWFGKHVWGEEVELPEGLDQR